MGDDDDDDDDLFFSSFFPPFPDRRSEVVMLTLFEVSFHLADVFLSSLCLVVDVRVDELLLLPVKLTVHDVVLTSFSFMDDLIFFFSFLKDDGGDDDGKADDGKDGSCGGREAERILMFASFPLAKSDVLTCKLLLSLFLFNVIVPPSRCSLVKLLVSDVVDVMFPLFFLLDIIFEDDG